MEKDITALAKSDSSATSSTPGVENFEYCRRKIRGILTSLRYPSDKYLPEKTVKSITDYISAGDRVIYSELTNIVFTMTPEERGTVATNLDSLMSYVFDGSNHICADVKKIALRLWDHFNLACYQIDNTSQILANSSASTKNELYNQLYSKFKGMETEYITILGIFASIMLAFVGGLTFSTSVLQNMGNVGIYRLVLVILLLGFILINTIDILLRYIFKLNHGEIRVPIWPVNLIIGVLTVGVIIAWLLSANTIPEYIQRFLPWLS